MPDSGWARGRAPRAIDPGADVARGSPAHRDTRHCTPTQLGLIWVFRRCPAAASAKPIRTAKILSRRPRGSALGYPALVAYGRLGLALIASRAGDAQTAATLHGAADAIHRTLGTRFDSLESRLRDADVTRLRAALGDTAFQTAYNAGYAPHIPVVAAPA